MEATCVLVPAGRATTADLRRDGGRNSKLSCCGSVGASINQRIELEKVVSKDENFRESTLRSRRGECSFGFVVLA